MPTTGEITKRNYYRWIKHCN